MKTSSLLGLALSAATAFSCVNEANPVNPDKKASAQGENAAEVKNNEKDVSKNQAEELIAKALKITDKTCEGVRVELTKVLKEGQAKKTAQAGNRIVVRFSDQSSCAVEVTEAPQGFHIFIDDQKKAFNAACEGKVNGNWDVGISE